LKLLRQADVNSRVEPMGLLAENARSR
jgi:hypothetical protein